MTKILAIDPSISSTGLCLNGKSETIKTKASSHTFKRIDKVLDRVDEIICNEDLDYVAMEQYSFNSPNTSSLTVLAELGGNIKMLLYKNNIEPIVVPATRWKKMVFNSPFIKKNMILFEMLKRYKMEFNNDDEADAFGIYKFVDCVIEHFKSHNFKYSYQEESMKTISFDMACKTDMVEKIRDKKKKVVYYYNGKKVASFGALSKAAGVKELYAIAFKKFNELYKIKG